MLEIINEVFYCSRSGARSVQGFIYLIPRLGAGRLRLGAGRRGEGGGKEGDLIVGPETRPHPLVLAAPTWRPHKGVTWGYSFEGREGALWLWKRSIQRSLGRTSRKASTA